MKMEDVKKSNEIVTLTFGDVVKETIRCQKCLLIDNSDYFRAMFSSGMIESQNNEVRIKDVDISVMKELIEYIITKKISLTGDMVYSITAAACRFQITDLIQICCTYLEKTLWHTSCISTLELSQIYDLRHLFNVSKRHLQHYFTQVSKTDEFLSVQVTTLQWLLQEKALNVESELDVYTAFERWIDADVDNRLQYADELCTFIHMEELPDQPGREQKLKYLKISQEDVMKNRNKKNRMFRQVPKAMLCVGLQFLNKSSNKFVFYPGIYKFSTEDNCFDLKKCVAHMSEVWPNIEGHGGLSVCVNGKDIIISGGEPVLGKNTWNLNVFCFDTFTQKWRILTNLPSLRRHHTSCVLDNSLYLIGGFGRYRVRLNSMEKYIFDEGKWYVMAPSPMHGFHSAVTVMNSNIYALFSNSAAFYYSPIQDTWTHLLLPSAISMDTISFVGLYSYNDMMYARTNTNKIYIIKIDSAKSLEIVSSLEHFVGVHGNTQGMQICNDVMCCIYTQNDPEMLYVKLHESHDVTKVKQVVKNYDEDLILTSECKWDLVTIPVYD